jgi:cobalt-zinc-cadmium efflux system outer membrane protein
MTFRRWWLAVGCCTLLLAAPAEPARAQSSPLSQPPFEGQLRSQAVLPSPANAAEPVPADVQAPLAAGGAAQPAVELTLEGLIELALANNPTLRQYAARIEVQRGHWVQGGLFPNPNVGYAGFQMGDSGQAGQQGVYLEQPLVAPQKLSLNRATASQDIRRAEQQFAAQRQRVINDVRLRYFDVLYAQRAVEVTRELLRIGQQGLQAAEDLFRGEQVSRIDVLQARVEVHAARINLRRAENRHQAAWQELTAVAGAPHLTLAPLAGDLAGELPVLEFQSTLERIVAVSPELAAAEAGLESARFALARARVEPYPNGDLQYYPQHDNTTTDDIHTVQFYLTVPLFNRNQGNIAAAQARLAAAQGEVERVSLELRNRLAAAFEQYANAQQQAQQYAQSILPDAQESLRLVREAYGSGQIGYLQLLTSQRTYFQANLAYLEALRELRQNVAVIDGLLLVGSLQAPPALD